MKNGLALTPDIDPGCFDIGAVYPYTVMCITDRSGREGKLIIDSEDAKLRFEGDVDESAKMFFDEVVKHHLPKAAVAL